ncbi:protein of unknown function (plasmid) [Caballeronia sp. S22]
MSLGSKRLNTIEIVKDCAIAGT